MTDFAFCIDIGQYIVVGPVHWSIPDSEAAYRGLMVRQVETADGKRKATKHEIVKYKNWVDERISRGLPPWVGRKNWTAGTPGVPDDVDVLKSSRTLRQWADDYCASPKYLKEFTYEKVSAPL